MSWSVELFQNGGLCSGTTLTIDFNFKNFLNWSLFPQKQLFWSIWQNYKYFLLNSLGSKRGFTFIFVFKVPSSLGWFIHRSLVIWITKYTFYYLVNKALSDNIAILCLNIISCLHLFWSKNFIFRGTTNIT